MGNKTKIVVLRLKEIIYTGIFALLAILFIVLLIIMFFPDKKDEEKKPVTQESALYQPGIYHQPLSLGGKTLEIEVMVDEKNINSIEMRNLDEATETMYPLIEPSFEDLSNQILSSQSIEGITYSDDSKYTALVLLDAIKEALAKASPLSPETSE